MKKVRELFFIFIIANFLLACGSNTSKSSSDLQPPTTLNLLKVSVENTDTGASSSTGSGPLITSPAIGDTLSGSKQIFLLNDNGINFTNWYLRIGSSLGGNDIANRFAAGSANNITISGLPTDGRAVYVRLRYKENGIWRTAGDYTYTAWSITNTPEISSPVSGSTLSGTTEIFSLDNKGINFTNWYLRIGSSLGSNDIANRFAAGSANNITIDGLPTDGRAVYVRLRYKENGIWRTAGDYNYTAWSLTNTPEISSPVSGSTLSGTAEIFSLDNKGINFTNWYLRIGSSLGGNDIANRFAAVSANNITINGLPTDGRIVFVRLRYKQNGIWKTAGDYTYLSSMSIPTLVSSEAQQGIVDKDQYKHYKIHALAGETVKVDLYDMDADGDLYVQIGSAASATQFNCRSVNRRDDDDHAIDDSCSVTLNQNADVYIAVHAYHCINNVQYTIKSTINGSYGQIGSANVVVARPYPNSYPNIRIHHPDTWATEPTPVVIFAPGWSPGNYDKYKKLLDFIASHGYTAIYVENSAHRTEVDLEDRFAKYEGVISDFADKVDTTRIGVVGFSLGGGQSYYYLKRSIENGWGDNGKFIFAYDPMFAWAMSETDLNTLANANIVIFATGHTVQQQDPRILLNEFAFLTNTSIKKDYQLYLNLEHDSIYSENIIDEGEIVTSLDALMSYTFESDDKAYQRALNYGPRVPYTNPWSSGTQKVENEEGFYGETCGHDYEAPDAKKGIDYCLNYPKNY